jgi:hypothetical protein
MSAIGGKAEHRPDCTAKWLTFSNETVCCALREKAALVASWGQPPKFGKGAGRMGAQSALARHDLGALGLNPRIFGQMVPRDDVSSAASGWSKCGKKLVTAALVAA